MKKIFTLIAVAVLGFTSMQAQTITINKVDGSVVTLNASEIKNIEFNPEEEVDPTTAFAGTYSGRDSMNVGGQFPYIAEGKPEYKVEANADGTINVVVPEENVKGTVMGDLTLSSYTIKNIPYDEEKQAYVYNYKKDKVVFHFLCVNPKGVKTIDKDYTMGWAGDKEIDKDICNIMLKVSDGVLTISNSYLMGSMPFVITNTYVAKKK